jgi:hypothetical protein
MKRVVNKIEVILVAVIVISIFLLTHTIDSKLRTTTITHNVLTSETQSKDMFIKEPFSYNLDSVTEVEVYDARMVRLSKNIFKDDHNNVSIEDLANSYELFDIIRKNPHGHIDIVLPDGSSENVYFRWGYDERGTRELLVVYNAGNIVSGVWMLNFLCYLILVFVFGLVILHKLHTQEIYIKDYQDTQNRVQERMR